ncbi:MAG TPA: hypothetical protein V6C81_08715 [Planktothrix sp.]|jgi:hypothetical protein
MRAKFLFAAMMMAALTVVSSNDSYASQLISSYVQFGPEHPRIHSYGLEGIMPMHDARDYEPSTGLFERGTDGNFDSPRLIRLFKFDKDLNTHIDEVAKHLYHKESVEQVWLYDVELPDYEVITSTPNLCKVDVNAGDQKYCPQQLIDALATNQSLRVLTLHGDLSYLDLSPLQNLHRLARIELINPRLSFDNVQQLGRSRSLHSLDVCLEQLPGPWLENLCKLSNVDDFALYCGNPAGSADRVALSAERLNFLKKLPKLRCLRLTMPADGLVVQLVSNLPKLETLTIFVSDDSIIPRLARLKGLRALELCGSGIHGETLSALQHSPLEYLALVSCQLSDEGYLQLAKLQSLRALQISGAPNQVFTSQHNLLMLADLTELRLLDITVQCPDMEKVLARLSKSLPNCSMQAAF